MVGAGFWGREGEKKRGEDEYGVDGRVAGGEWCGEGYWCRGEGEFLGKGSEGQTLKVFGRE